MSNRDAVYTNLRATDSYKEARNNFRVTQNNLSDLSGLVHKISQESWGLMGETDRDLALSAIKLLQNLVVSAERAADTKVWDLENELDELLK